MTEAIDWSAARQEAVEVLGDLIRFDTTNPPGNETPAAEYLAERFRKEGIEVQVLESAPGRGNVVARLSGENQAPPLMISAHLDVVPADPAEWTHPPFAGTLADGYLWGRGAVDMKYVAAQALGVMSLLKRHGVPLKRDIIFAGVADEEQGGRRGAGFLVDEHRSLIQAEYCLTEVGGMVLPMGKGVACMVQVGMRGFEWIRVRAKGNPGHGSKPNDNNAIHLLAAGLERLRGNRVGHHVCNSTDVFLKDLAKVQGGASGLILSMLRNPLTAPLALKLIPGEKKGVLEAAVYNTAIPTGLDAGDNDSPNVVREGASAVIDGRYLPGVSREEFLTQIQEALGEEFELEPFRGLPPVEFPDQSELLDTIESVVKGREPSAKMVRFLMQGFTDAAHYARADITTYGFAPVILKENEPFADLYHSPNERISVEGFGEGLSWLHDVVTNFCGAP